MNIDKWLMEKCRIEKRVRQKKRIYVRIGISQGSNNIHESIMIIFLNNIPVTITLTLHPSIVIEWLLLPNKAGYCTKSQQIVYISTFPNDTQK